MIVGEHPALPGRHKLAVHVDLQIVDLLRVLCNNRGAGIAESSTQGAKSPRSAPARQEGDTMRFRLVVMFALLPLARQPLSAAPQGAGDVGWPLHNFDLGNTRFSPLDQIDTSNVDRLVPAWSLDVDPDTVGRRALHHSPPELLRPARGRRKPGGSVGRSGRRDARGRAQRGRLRPGRGQADEGQLPAGVRQRPPASQRPAHAGPPGHRVLGQPPREDRPARATEAHPHALPAGRAAGVAPRLPPLLPAAAPHTAASTP